MIRLLLILTPMFLMAGETDIVPRSIHFVIFVALMYYLLANPVKNFYNSRIEGISNRLKSVEDSLENARKNKESTMKKIEKANKDAEELLLLAKDQADKLEEQLLKDVNSEIKMMDKHYEEQKVFEERRVKLEVAEELIDEMLNSKINLRQDELLGVIARKVS